MRHTRPEVIARTQREFARLDRVVRRLGAADWKRRVPRPPTRDADVLQTLAKTPDAWFGRRERSSEWPLDFDGHSAAHRVKEAALPGAAPRRARATGARSVTRETTNQR
jgi:hypothetical protein